MLGLKLANLFPEFDDPSFKFKIQPDTLAGHRITPMVVSNVLTDIILPKELTNVEFVVLTPLTELGPPKS